MGVADGVAVAVAVLVAVPVGVAVKVAVAVAVAVFVGVADGVAVTVVVAVTVGVAVGVAVKVAVAVGVDVAVAVDHIQLAAMSEGLGTAWLIEFNEEKVRAVLHVPEGIHPIAVIPIGYPAEPNGSARPPEEGRKSPDEIIAYNEYPW